MVMAYRLTTRSRATVRMLDTSSVWTLFWRTIASISPLMAYMREVPIKVMASISATAMPKPVAMMTVELRLNTGHHRD